MPTNYQTINGDTPQKIASKFYGDRSKGYLIVGANPGLKFVAYPATTSQVLVTNQNIIIPDQVDPTPTETAEPVKVVSLFDTTAQRVAADDDDEVILTIRGRAFKKFNQLSIKFDYDKIANEFSFTAPFEPDLDEYRAAFKPIYQPTAIYIGGQLIISGQSAARPLLTDDSNTVNVSGYAVTGNIDKSAITSPFEFDAGIAFSEIVSDIASRFGLAVVIDSAAADLASKPFEKRIAFEPNQPAGSKLATLARERGLIISSTYNGRVLITKPKTESSTVQAFVSGMPPALRFEPSFNPDALHTSYIAYAPETPDEEAEADSIELPGYPQPGIMPRIKGIVPGNTENQNIEDAIRAERGRAFGEWFNAILDVANWRDKNGQLYQPNTLVTVRAPRAMIYNDTTFFVRSVTLNKFEDRKTSRLELILPEALSGRDLSVTV